MNSESLDQLACHVVCIRPSLFMEISFGCYRGYSRIVKVLISLHFLKIYCGPSLNCSWKRIHGCCRIFWWVAMVLMSRHVFVVYCWPSHLMERISGYCRIYWWKVKVWISLHDLVLCSLPSLFMERILAVVECTGKREGLDQPAFHCSLLWAFSVYGNNLDWCTIYW